MEETFEYQMRKEIDAQRKHYMEQHKRSDMTNVIENAAVDFPDDHFTNN